MKFDVLRADEPLLLNTPILVSENKLNFVQKKCVNRANVLKTEIGVLKASEEVTRYQDLKDKNVLLRSERLLTEAE